ncbi:MAG TPA: CPBP family intramembrane glutamic endopeptidase [Allosphingosinicella sp.]|jgi:membrane protease YdiL (CAAX protease family)
MELWHGLSIGRPGRLGWLICIGLPSLLFLAAVGAERLFQGSWPNLRLALTSNEYPYLTSAELLGAQIFFYGIGEELGWRGVALPSLMSRMSALAASALLTAPWALWHLPLFLTNETYIEMGVAGVVGWILSLLTGSVLMGWLFLATNRSVLVVATFHGLLDLAMVNPALGPIGMNAAGALVTFVGMAAAVLLWRGPCEAK